MQRPLHRNTLGLRLKTEDPVAAVFDLNGATLQLSNVAGWKPHPKTVLGFDVPDIHAAVQALSAQGVNFLICPGCGQDAAGAWAAPDGSARVTWFNEPDVNNPSLTQVG